VTATIKHQVAHQWASQVFQQLGYREPEADYLADTLVEANLRGVDSHGLIRLPIYSKRIEAGLVDPAAHPVISRDRGLVRIDAAGAPGQLAARAGVDEAERSAREHGAGCVAIHGSTHFGTAGYYARSLAERGLAALVMSNSEPIVVPFGGRQALFGTNPIAFAAPTEDGVFCFDMATSVVAMGKVLNAQASGTSIPADWGVDISGEPTTDPSKVAAVQHFGGPKGYAMAFMIEILAGVLTGAAVTSDLGNQYTDFDRRQETGHFMLALDIAGLLPLADFTSRMGRLADQAHAVPAAGEGGVLVPGEPEERIRRRRLVEGLTLPPDVITELTELGARLGVPFPNEGAA
jgi:LDH2 family malate/lactate/ureidoglycolate dehydrogenase